MRLDRSLQEKRHVSRFNYQRKSLHREVSVTFGRYTENEGVLYHANFSSRGYSAFRKMVPYAAFHYPVFSLLVVAAIVLLVCLATPVITFMQNVKQSVVERLRQN